MKNAKKHALPKVILPPEPQLTDLGFDPVKTLADALQARAVCEGISIDSARTQLIDDGFSIEKNKDGSGWVIRTSIADVPAVVPEDSNLGKFVLAKFQNDALVLKQKYSRSSVIRNFPNDLLDQYQSLHQGRTRPAMTFTMRFGADFRMQGYTIERNAFKNMKQCHYGPLGAQYTPVKDQVKDWYRLAFNIQAGRHHDMAEACDAVIGYSDSPGLPLRNSAAFNASNENECLIQELMRLTNAVTTDFAMKNGLTVPGMQQEKRIIVEYVSRNEKFERECDALAWDVIQKYSDDRPAKARLTSPMRLYSDYVTMQVLARALDGHAESSALAHEATRLTKFFNANAERNPFRPDQLPSMRETTRASQDRKHPFDYLTGHKDDIASARLNKRDRPDVSIRKLHIQGGYVYLVGMRQKNGAHKSWAISHDYETAREMASLRMLAGAQPGTPALG